MTTAQHTHADQLRPVDPDLFRTLLGRPTGAACVVTAVARGSRPACLGDLGAPLRSGFTATSLTAVSQNPPLVSFQPDPISSGALLLDRAEHVAVHLLGADQIEVAAIFATNGVDPFVAYPRWAAGPFGLPLLTGVLGRLLCRVVRRVPAGGQRVIAEPLALSAGEPLARYSAAVPG
ncbi:flavin reductase family protein [Micromonospora radicis]|uniref:Flavin reductase n=1 Tax=Micromonospora radicis TaxID=1894971 RepID=A0A418MY42_9ACTN|nr:flavin reductase family protein [Micromonospora radicis]RIV39774.1 flavin reductase [Micromonospora radicis]